MGHLAKPKIRNINIQPSRHQGQSVFIMYDSLRLSESMIALPQALGPLVMLCNGENSIADIQTLLTAQYGLELPAEVIGHLVTQFDDALLLEGGRFEQVKQQTIESYRAAPYRRPALAGISYPAEPNALRRLLQNYLDKAGDVPLMPAESRAIISPHIDYQRGGHVYAQVWASAAEAIRAAELIIIFATDHNGGAGTLTLTEQHYATPLGHFPTDREMVRQLAEIIGPEAAFAEELHHINEHSIELVFLWLQYMRQEKPCPVVPILCGSFYPYMRGKADINQNSTFQQMRDFLRAEMAKRRTVIVASGDLAHMGPAFDGPPMDGTAHADMVQDDDALMTALAGGNAAEWLTFMKGAQYGRNVCGLSPFYFTLDVLESSMGHRFGYERCPADEENTSFVSVCGMVMT